MDWNGHSFAFMLRVDVEHVEAQRYTGDLLTTRVAVTNLLDMFAEMDTRHSFCLLGITAEMFPNLAKDIAAGHEVFGHGMYHEPALAGRPFAEQRHEMLRMRDSIESACGVRVRGVGIPHHGLADESTLRAAAEVGLEYVQCNIRAQGSVLPRYHSVEGTDLQVLVMGDQGRGASDYSSRRRTWARVHEEAFSPEGATQKWKGMIDWARENGSLCGLVIHPWMMMINPGEVKVVREVISYARDQGGWMGTYDALADMGLAHQGE